MLRPVKARVGEKRGGGYATERKVMYPVLGND